VPQKGMGVQVPPRTRQQQQRRVRVPQVMKSGSPAARRRRGPGGSGSTSAGELPRRHARGSGGRPRWSPKTSASCRDELQRHRAAVLAVGAAARRRSAASRSTTRGLPALGVALGAPRRPRPRLRTMPAERRTLTRARVQVDMSRQRSASRLAAPHAGHGERVPEGVAAGNWPRRTSRGTRRAARQFQRVHLGRLGLALRWAAWPRRPGCGAAGRPSRPGASTRLNDGVEVADGAGGQRRRRLPVILAAGLLEQRGNGVVRR
jgi:hypothetical protein